MLNQRSIEFAIEQIILHSVFDEIEDADAHAVYKEGMNEPLDVVNKIMEEQRPTAMYVIGNLIGHVEAHWKHTLCNVFHHAGFDPYSADTEKENGRRIFRLMMGVFGHGIFLGDDSPSGPVALGLEKAAKILNDGKPFDTLDIYFDQYSTVTDELVTQHLDYPEVGDIVEIDTDGRIITFDPDKNFHYGETLEEYGVENLNDYEKRKLSEELKIRDLRH